MHFSIGLCKPIIHISNDSSSSFFHFHSSCFQEENQAPSFLSAFHGDPSLASRFVMSVHQQMQLRSDTSHRLVNTLQLSAYTISWYSFQKVDYIYWRTCKCCVTYSVKNCSIPISINYLSYKFVTCTVQSTCIRIVNAPFTVEMFANFVSSILWLLRCMIVMKNNALDVMAVNYRHLGWWTSAYLNWII